MKPIQLIDRLAATTLRVALWTRKDRIKALYPPATHQAAYKAEMAQLEHLCSELGIAPEEL